MPVLGGTSLQAERRRLESDRIPDKTVGGSTTRRRSARARRKELIWHAEHARRVGVAGNAVQPYVVARIVAVAMMKTRASGGG